ncbi:MAG: hypothetical protein MJZ03_00290 [archaeon]|nr:hypothetical protein [archaeon]
MKECIDMNLKERSEQLKTLYPDWSIQYCDKFINKVWYSYEAIEVYTDTREWFVVRYEDGKWLFESDGVSFDTITKAMTGLEGDTNELDHLKSENAELQSRIDTLTAMMREEDYYE